MAYSARAKNFRDGKLTIQDATGTPLTWEFVYEPGDISIDDLEEGGKEVVDYKDRGDFFDLHYTNQLYPKISGTVVLTQILGTSTDGGPFDTVMKLGSWSSAVSTLGTASGLPFTADLIFRVEGTNYGDSTDYVYTFAKCRGRISIKEGDPSTYSFSFTCYGGAVPTRV